MLTGLKLCILGLSLILLASAALAQELETPEEHQAESLAQSTLPLESQQVQSLAVNNTYIEPLSDYNVSLANNATIGQYLTDSRGMTLYYFANDTRDISNCYDQCALNWPPFFNNIQSDLVELSHSDFSTITRTDGRLQTAFRGWPLYYFIGDRVPGDVNGQGKNGVWFAASPARLQQVR